MAATFCKCEKSSKIPNLVTQRCCTAPGRSGISREGCNSASTPRIAPPGRHHGRPVPLLLPEFRMPRSRQARRRKSDRDQPLRAREVAAHAPLSGPQGPLLRRKGTPLSDARLPLPRSRTTWTTLFGHPVQAGCGATFTPQGRASRTRLNGVAVARRKRVNPPAITTSRSRASPAWAPRANPTS